MSVWYTIRESLEGFRRARMAAAITTFTVAFALVLMALVYIVASNLGRVVLNLRARVQMEAFLDPSLTDQEAQKIEDRIRAVAGVEQVEFVSKEKALLEFEREFGEDIFSVLDDNPLPASFRIRLKPEFQRSDLAKRVADAVGQIEGVDEVVYRGDVLALLDRYMGIVLLGGAVFGFLIGLGSVLLISNTIRLAILTRANVIEIMQLVGATNSFIRRPFVLEGMLQGTLGGLLAALTLYALVRAANLEIPNLVVVDRRLYLVVVLVGWLLGALGSAVAVRKFLK
ncbi:MAG TPA: ABC transporter permease [Bacteroidetes bacterium]|nr:ABC transporter permease [Bacteroidota bacterium]